MWLERAGGLGEFQAFRLLADCYENGYYDVPVNAEKAALWRSRLEEYERLNPPSPSVRYSIEDAVSESALERLLDIEGVTGFAYMTGAKEINVCYDSALIAFAELDEKIRAAGIPAIPTTERRG